MSREEKTVLGIAWSIGTNLGSRALSLLGTLLLARYLDPGDYGQVMAASVVATSAQSVSNVGLPQYLVARPRVDNRFAFHVSFYSALIGAVAMVIGLALGPVIGPAFRVNNIMKYLPWLSAVALLDRVSTVPERLLYRDLRFKVVSINNAFGDLIYTALSLATVRQTHGMSIIWGNVGRSLFRAGVLWKASGSQEWMKPIPIDRAITRELFAFGMPLTLGNWASFVSRRWDNLLVSRYFGAAVMGAYNYAYNLASVPALQVGEQIGAVLLPSFGHLEGQKRRVAFARSLRLLALLDFPLAVGLAAISPTVVKQFFDPRWWSIAPMLTVLGTLSLAYPLGYTAGCYLQAIGRPALVSYLEVAKAALLFGGIALLRPFGPVWACAAVAVAFTLHAVASLVVVHSAGKVPLMDSLGGILRPLCACVPLAAAVVAVQHLSHRRGLAELGLEVGVGAAVYVVSALVIAPTLSRDFLKLAWTFLGRRKVPPEATNPSLPVPP